MEGERPTGVEQPPGLEPEARRDRSRRMARRGTYYAQAILLAVLGLLVLLLAVDNTNRTTLHWIVGSTRAAVVWIVLASAAVGWLAGVMTAVLFRRRTRRR